MKGTSVCTGTYSLSQQSLDSLHGPIIEIWRREGWSFLPDLKLFYVS